jgi:outer membrane biosynthesis protein TonB
MMRSAASADEINEWIKEFSKKFEGNEDVLDGIQELKDIVENSPEDSIPARKPGDEDEKSKISSEIRLLKTVVKLAQTKPEYKKYIPVILAKITKNKKKKSDKKSEKDEKPVKSAAPSKSEKKEDKKKSDKKDKSSSKKKKASVSLSAVDTNW